jgi:hypothetical protein
MYDTTCISAHQSDTTRMRQQRTGDGPGSLFPRKVLGMFEQETWRSLGICKDLQGG